MHAVNVDSIPRLGPYSHAMAAPPFLFLAGQIPVVGATGEVLKGDVGAATEQVIQNIRTVLAAAGCDLTHVVKTTVFLTDMAHFSAMNAVYGAHFVTHHPARSTVAVKALPGGADVEIEVVALLPVAPVAPAR